MPPPVKRPDGTRDEILALLRRHTSMSVEDLARELGLSPATVRRHLDVLLRDDFVSVAQVRGGTGRPKHVFTLTEVGAEMFPHHYVRMTHRLLGEIVSLGEAETAGRSGRQIADVVFDRMAARLAAEYGPRASTSRSPSRMATSISSDAAVFALVSMTRTPRRSRATTTSGCWGSSCTPRWCPCRPIASRTSSSAGISYGRDAACARRNCDASLKLFRA